MKFTLTIILALIIFSFSGCNKDYIPKPRGYYRISFPEKSYQKFEADYPYKFEYPSYSDIETDTSGFSEPFWINVVTNKNKAKLHLSYKPVKDNLAELTEESRELAYKHTIKAITINEKIFVNDKNKVYGTVYEIKGNTASPMQFHLTDSAKHFLRGSVYISEIPNYDSLLPVINFLEKDVYHLIETFNWE